MSKSIDLLEAWGTRELIMGTIYAILFFILFIGLLGNDMFLRKPRNITTKGFINKKYKQTDNNSYFLIRFKTIENKIVEIHYIEKTFKSHVVGDSIELVYNQEEPEFGVIKIKQEEYAKSNFTGFIACIIATLFFILILLMQLKEVGWKLPPPRISKQSNPKWYE